MTDSNNPSAMPSAPTLSADPFLAEYEAHGQVAATLHDPNKAALFDVLETAGVTLVIVSFDGVGDSGQVESIDAKAGDEMVDLPSGEIEIRSAVWGEAQPVAQNLPIADAIEHLAYDFLSETHGGWENNDGAYGDFTFDVAARTITLDYNERYTASENYVHEF